MKKKIIFVTGMHRSGTSILAKGLSSIKNINLSSQLIPAHSDNIKGYFEDQLFVEMNEYILKKLHSSWSNVDKLKKNINGINNRKKLDRQLIDGCVRELRRIFNQTNDHIVIKDPRFALLIEFYFDHIFHYFSEEEFLFIIVYRHPREVIHSLMKRDKLTFKEAEKLWCTYNTNLIERVKVYKNKFFVICINDIIDKSFLSFVKLIKFIYNNGNENNILFWRILIFSFFKILIFRYIFFDKNLLSIKVNIDGYKLSKKTNFILRQLDKLNAKF